MVTNHVRQSGRLESLLCDVEIIRGRRKYTAKLGDARVYVEKSVFSPDYGNMKIKIVTRAHYGEPAA